MMTYHVQFLLLVLAGWVNRQQQDVIDYQQEENRVLRAGLRGKRLRLSDDDRRRLAVKAQALGREALAQIASVACAFYLFIRQPHGSEVSPAVPWCINTGKSLIPLTLLFLQQKRNLLIPLELSRVMHQGTLRGDKVCDPWSLVPCSRFPSGPPLRLLDFLVLRLLLLLAGALLLALFLVFPAALVAHRVPPFVSWFGVGTPTTPRSITPIGTDR